MAPRLWHPTSWSASLRFLTLLLVPSVLGATSLAFSIVATASDKWAVHTVITTGGGPDLTGRPVQIPRSPFANCTYEDFVPDNPAMGAKVLLSCNRSTTPGALCDPTGFDNIPFCAQLTLVGQLCIAACALFGVACVLSLATLLYGFASTLGQTDGRRRQRSHRGVKPDLLRAASFLWLLTATGTVCMAAAQLLGYITLVSGQFPNGEFLIPAAPDKASAWHAGIAISYAGAAWILGAFGAACNVACGHVGFACAGGRGRGVGDGDEGLGEDAQPKSAVAEVK
jgi:hypothetical protein